VKSLRICVTDALRGMKEEAPVNVVNGSATLTVDRMSYTTAVGAE